ncbi:universal stress protein [Acidicapsa acidisoli]|uniref:universal stress protein n=1 Tax=Acidicapsa acidisoli TaxID=1615681 RepID=UPI0021E07560|nr:universal stress protein [Acidicapsa acidisoli]
MNDTPGNFLEGKVNRILVPVNFSPKTSLVLEHAIAVAHVYGASLLLMHVLNATAFVANSVPGATLEILQRSESALEELAESVRMQHIDCQILMRKGDLDTQIEQVIAEYRVDILVLGTQAASNFGGFALASTAERILRKTMIPVLTVADCRPVRKWVGEGHFHVFGVTDLSPESIRNFEYARALRRRLPVEYTLAHVLPKHATPERIEAATEQLHAVVQFADTKVEVLEGAIGPTICQASARAGADLIITSVRKHSVLREILLGHTLLEILYGASCPVLTIRME